LCRREGNKPLAAGEAILVEPEFGDGGAREIGLDFISDFSGAARLRPFQLVVFLPDPDFGIGPGSSGEAGRQEHPNPRLLPPRRQHQAADHLSAEREAAL
jgi:hypothetical protein